MLALYHHNNICLKLLKCFVKISVVESMRWRWLHLQNESQKHINYHFIQTMRTLVSQIHIMAIIAAPAAPPAAPLTPPKTVPPVISPTDLPNAPPSTLHIFYFSTMVA